MPCTLSSKSLISSLICPDTRLIDLQLPQPSSFVWGMIVSIGCFSPDAYWLSPGLLEATLGHLLPRCHSQLSTGIELFHPCLDKSAMKSAKFVPTAWRGWEFAASSLHSSYPISSQLSTKSTLPEKKLKHNLDSTLSVVWGLMSGQGMHWKDILNVMGNRRNERENT